MFFLTLFCVNRLIISKVSFLHFAVIYHKCRFLLKKFSQNSHFYYFCTSLGRKIKKPPCVLIRRGQTRRLKVKDANFQKTQLFYAVETVYLRILVTVVVWVYPHSDISFTLQY